MAMITATAQNTEQEDNFSEMAIWALEQAGNDRPKAQAILKDRILGDPDLLQRNLERIVNCYAGKAIGKLSQHRRDEQPSMMNVVPIDGRVFNQAVGANFDRYMSRPAWGGKQIGSCTAAELRESGERYAKQGSSMIRESSWEFAVAEALEANRKTPEATVSDVLHESALAILWSTVSDD